MKLRFPDLPSRMERLPVDDRGFPVPWFVHWKDGEPLFPVISMDKVAKAHVEDRCWVCGERLGAYRASVIGPMCAINRTISEPPSHTECARFSARNCPFLANPRMKRVPDAKLLAACPEGGHGEEAILRNPGVTCVWVARKQSKPFRTRSGNPLFTIPDPVQVEWYANGRLATRAEVEASIDSGIGLLRQECDNEPTPARRDLAHAELSRRHLFVLNNLLPVS